MSKDGAVIDSADNMVSFLRFKETYVKRRQKNVLESIAFGLNKLNNWKIKIKAKDYIPSWIKAAEKPQETKEEFSESIPESVILDEFRKYGEDKSKYKFLHSQEFSGDSDEDVINGYLNSRFADVTPRQSQILGLIDKGENWMSIRSALNIPVTELAKEFMRLEKEGLVKNGKVTNQGKQNISVRQELRVVYSYELRPEISSQPKVIDGTRDFCRVLIEELNRVYTREEINQISASVGRDVWAYRGGWYHNPDTGKNRPSCRHIWKQNVITA
jgi:DNA gyrase/topoisomerase IV subunit A